jgi:hypothetical protein
MNEHERLFRMFDEAKSALRALADEAHVKDNVYIMSQVELMIVDLNHLARFVREEP